MNDIQLVISQKVTEALFNQLRDNFAVSHSDSGSFGHFTASYSAGIKLQNGKLDFQSNGTVLIKELDIVYDPLTLTLGIDIPEVTVGGFCLVPKPFGGCLLRAPKKTFFGGNPDFSVPLDLSGIIATEISASCSAKLKHYDDPSNAGITPWKAQAFGNSDQWQLFLEPGYIDIDVIDIPDTVGNLIDKMVDAAVDKLLSFLPGWARGLVKKALGNFSKLIRKLLNIGDNAQEWLSNLLGVSLGLFEFAVHMVFEYLADRNALFEFDDPYPMLPAAPGPGGSGVLVPVLVPIKSPDITINDKEMIISASVGVL